MTGKMVIISGPSGVGKDTVIDAWKALDPCVVRVIAYTTRSPRPGEQDGIDYHFVSTERFLDMAADGEFMEHKLVHGNYYATPLTDAELLVADGKIAILKIDVQGALAVMELRPDIESIFILPPSIEELEHRIRSRATDGRQDIETRLKNASEEIAQSANYRHRVVNDDVDRAVAEIMSLVAQDHRKH